MNEPQTDEPQASTSQANEPETTAPDADSSAPKQQGAESKTRQKYDASTSEATREMRDTSRRRRDAEVKLQQHLREAKDHVPHQHEHDEQPEAEHDEQPKESGHEKGADGTS